ncbi:rhomboid family protein [Numidum massiliense]|uniref:rhomboid family protein n=1 Tax=Numidum massiliense TaxID=1522315 RepID=UPI0006D55F54|nr:rhomboid family intramembrane serine protease [Numidum massiliense]
MQSSHLQSAIWLMAKKLVHDNQCSLFYIEKDDTSGQGDEPYAKALHLVSERHKKVLYLRLVPLESYWAQVVERDVMESKHRFQQLARRARTALEAVNIYVLPESPSDEMVERARAASAAPERAPFTLQTLFFNLEQGTCVGGVSSLERWGVALPALQGSMAAAREVTDLREIRLQIHNTEREREQKMLSVFRHGKPLFTWLLLIVNAIVYGLVLLNGGVDNRETLINFGVKFNSLIAEGEWWRLVTPIFLHLGHLHFLFNSMALYFIGSAVERIYGSWRFLAIYLLAGISGSLASFAFTSNISAGASGAIFGCFGAMLVFGQLYPKLFFRTLGRDIIFFLILNLVIGFVTPSIDNYGHIGGLLGGYLAALAISLPRKQHRPVWRLLAALVLVVGMYGVFVYGNEEVQQDPTHLSWKAEQFLREQRFEQAQAMYEEVVRIDPENAAAYFQLGIIYWTAGDYDKVESMWKKALQLDPVMTEEAIANIFGHGERATALIEELRRGDRKDSRNKTFEKLLRELED